MNFGLFTLWTPGEMADAQANLAQSADSVNRSVQACTTLDAATSGSWGEFYSTLKAFTSTKPVAIFAGSGEAITTGTRADQMQQLANELLAWQDRLSAKCTLAPGLSRPTSYAPDVIQVAKWGFIAVGAVAVAVVVSKVTHEMDVFRKPRAA